MLNRLSRRELTVAGLRLSFLERDAPSDKPAILLLHGLTAEAEVFRKLIAELPSDRRIIALDMPGAGYSERSLTADVTFAGLAAILAEFISVSGLPQPVVLGHSHGGTVALELAVNHPAEVAALVLMCPAHPFSTHEDKLVRFYLSRIGRRFARLLPKLPRRILLFAFRRMPGSRASLGYDDIEPYVHTLRGPGTVPHILRLLESWQQDMKALGAVLQQRPIHIPVLLLWGDRDIVVPISTFTDLSKCFTHWEMASLGGVGHLPNEEAPAECGSLISTWMRQLEDVPERIALITEAS